MKRKNLLNHNPNLSPLTIDVLIPVYNNEKYIISAIRSVERQTFKPQRIIVVDDGSTDDTSNLVLNYKRSIHIDYIRQKNCGPSSARNSGIKSSTSNFIAFLDADDEWCEVKLEEQIRVFQNSKFLNLGVVYCGYVHIDADGNLCEKYPTIELEPALRGDVYESLLKGKHIPGSASAVLIKKECFDKVGFFDENLRAAEDIDMWRRLAEYYEYDYVDKKLVKIRMHGENQQSNVYFMFSNELIFYSKWINKIDRHHLFPVRKNISDRIISRLRKLDFKEAAKYVRAYNKMFSKETNRKIFSVALGSLRLYLFIRIIIMAIMKIKRLFLSLIVKPKKASKHFGIINK